MRTLLLIAFVFLLIQSRSSVAQSPEGTSLSFMGTDTTFQMTDILCSPNKDTIFVVRGATTDLILEVWDQPAYREERPVFIYVTKSKILQMSSMPRYMRKNDY